MITLDEANVPALHLYVAIANTTPRLDALARDGVVFDRAFCTFPKCTPSRAALLSGRYPHTGGHRTTPSFELDADEDSLARRLRSAGYRTAMVGKNHTVVPDGVDEHFDVRPAPHGQDVPWDRRADETDDRLFRAFYRGDFSDISEIRDNVTTDSALASTRPAALRSSSSSTTTTPIRPTPTSSRSRPAFGSKTSSFRREKHSRTPSR